MSFTLHLSHYNANLCSLDCDVRNCLSHCDMSICSSQCEMHICSLHCDVTKFGRLHCYSVRHIMMFGNVCHIGAFVYVRHIMMFGNVCHIGAFVYVRHIVMLLCMVDGNFTMFDTLRCLEMFVTL
jgi:hypothetical protein